MKKRRIEFDNYKRNNHLDIYRFFIDNRSWYKSARSLHIDDISSGNANYISEISSMHEITNVHTLAKYIWLARNGAIDLYFNNAKVSIDDVRENALMQKLAGLVG